MMIYVAYTGYYEFMFTYQQNRSLIVYTQIYFVTFW
jgi:hypothetical protein